jgi:hypothetical protein
LVIKGSKITEDEGNLILELYNSGISIQDISIQMKRNWKTVARKIHNSGISPQELWDKGERKKKNILFNKDQELEIIEKYKNGASLLSLGREYNCTHTSIRNVLKRNNIKLREVGIQKHYFSEEDINNIINLYTIEKYSQEKIGKIYNIGQTIISRLLKSNGISDERFAKERHSNWKNGTSRCRDYMMVKIDYDSPYYCMVNKSDYVMEHRLVVAESIGRPLTKSETVHHINGDKLDNRIENLQIHHNNHGTGVVYKCADCGSHNIVETEINMN